MLGDLRTLRIWGWLLLAIFATEALLHTPLGDYVPDAPKWGHVPLGGIVERASKYAKDGAVDVLVLGNSQGQLWVDEGDLRNVGLRAVNASVPGANMGTVDFLASRIFLPSLKPRLVVITVGPISFTKRHDHLISLIEASPGGGPVLRGERVRIWLNEHVMLLRKGGHSLSLNMVGPMRNLFTETNVVSNHEQQPLGVGEKATIAVYRSLGPQSEKFDAMAHLIGLAEASGARVVLINMPVRDDTKRGAAWDYADYLRQLERAVGAHPLLNLDNVTTDADLGDYVHPNDRGAQVVRPIVRDFILRQLSEASSK